MINYCFAHFNDAMKVLPGLEVRTHDYCYTFSKLLSAVWKYLVRSSVLLGQV